MKPSSYVTSGVAVVFAIVLSACTDTPVAPTASGASLSGASGRSAGVVTPAAPGASSAGTGSAVAQSARPWGPETPPFNVEVILRGEGFGLLHFRQPNDDALIIHLDTWVRDLAPNTSYLLQRAVDVNVDDNCTSTAWLTLGKGLEPQSITTDANGTGREELFRSVAAFPVGSQFDIHFRVISERSSAVVLTSQCYQFTISQ